MMFVIHAIRVTFLALPLALSACVGTGPIPNNQATLDSGSGIPSYVRNLPKSATGNMEQYVVFGKRYSVMDSAANFSEQGIASWYGKKFHGRKTSSGEIYNMHAMTAAHKHLPLPTFVRVTNLDNNRSVIVKVNDRGPFIGDRIIDMSFAAAQLLGMVEKGTANVRVDGLSTHFEDQQPGNKYLAGPAQPLPKQVTVQTAAVPIQPAPQSIPAAPAATDGDVQLAAARSAAPSQASDVNIDVSEDGLGNGRVTQNGVIEDGFVEYADSGNVSLAGTENLAANEPSDVATALALPEPRSAATTVQKGVNVYIQLGAFSEPGNARSMIDRIDQQTGLPSFMERDSEASLYRVKMGPFTGGEMLQKTLQMLARAGIESYTKLAAK